MNTSYNRLSSETSPYLLQHATNPVNWYPWGEEAFAKAKEHNKLMLISIGYSSCHWCHVMEKEAFTNEEVAEFMNNHFVCVKVDREERPDIDKIYMTAIQIITRAGGWPLNCFSLPNGKPVYGGTYFKPEAWLDILKSLHFTWMSEPKKVIEVAEELTQGIASTEIVEKKAIKQPLNLNLIQLYVKGWSKYFDSRYGANKGAPKFAMSGSLQFLLDYSVLAQNEEVKTHVKLTLNRMANGGIYDHLGGGFFRYSVDEQWFVPHFEKMLYDNAQLISLYTNAYKHFGDESYRSLVYQSVDFLRRELKAPTGGFFCSIDADSDGEEGNFYTYTKSEIDTLLGPDAELFSIVYGITASGVLMGKNVLRLAASIGEAACLLGLTPDEVEKRLKIAKAKLFNVRFTRIRPITDDKVLLSWNALTITALTNAYKVFGDNQFLADAIGIESFIAQNLIEENGVLKRVYCKGKSSVSAFLDDYAFLIQAYIALYQSTFEESWLEKAKLLTEASIGKFFDAKSGMFFYTSLEHNQNIVRKMEITDGVMPSSGAVMAENLLALGIYFRNDGYSAIASQMVQNILGQLERGGPYIYQWAKVLLQHILKSAEVCAAGVNAAEQLRSIARDSTYPNLITYTCQANSNLPIASFPLKEGEIKLCMGNTCQRPTRKPSNIVSAINAERPFGDNPQSLSEKV